MFTHRLSRVQWVVCTLAVLAQSLIFMTPGASASGQTYDVATFAEWESATQAAAPGDTIRLTATIFQALEYRGGNDGNNATPSSAGTASAPITITAAANVWIDPGNLANDRGALDILYVDFVNVVGVRVRNSQFGIRYMQSNGSAASPVVISSNVVQDIGHAGIYFGGHWDSHAPSTNGLIEDNVVTRTGSSAAAYGEGIYVGYGSTEWLDETSDVVIRGNDISYTGAEGVDVKPGTRNIVIEQNFIHDISPISGGAISAHYVNLTPNPNPAELDKVTIDSNRIWNINLDGRSGSNDWAIWVGHGGVDVVNNTIWGLRDDASRSRGVRVRATQPFGSHPINITGNTFWTEVGWLAEGEPSGSSLVSASDNVGAASGPGVALLLASAVIGPLPALGQATTADAGTGPGSVFNPSSAPPTSTTSTTQVTTTQPSTTQVTTTQPSTTQVSTTQPSTTQVSTTQPSTTLVSSTSTTSQPVGSDKPPKKPKKGGKPDRRGSGSRANLVWAPTAVVQQAVLGSPVGVARVVQRLGTAPSTGAEGPQGDADQAPPSRLAFDGGQALVTVTEPGALDGPWRAPETGWLFAMLAAGVATIIGGRRVRQQKISERQE